MSAYDTYEENRLATEFTVTGQHLNLLRHAYVGWEFREGRYVRSRYSADWRLAEGG